MKLAKQFYKDIENLIAYLFALFIIFLWSAANGVIIMIFFYTELPFIIAIILGFLAFVVQYVLISIGYHLKKRWVKW